MSSILFPFDTIVRCERGVKYVLTMAHLTAGLFGFPSPLGSPIHIVTPSLSFNATSSNRLHRKWQDSSKGMKILPNSHETSKFPALCALFLRTAVLFNQGAVVNATFRHWCSDPILERRLGCISPSYFVISLGYFEIFTIPVTAERKCGPSAYSWYQHPIAERAFLLDQNSVLPLPSVKVTKHRSTFFTGMHPGLDQTTVSQEASAVQKTSSLHPKKRYIRLKLLSSCRPSTQ